MEVHIVYMSTQDPIADMLTIIRNGQVAKKNKVYIISSTVKVAIAQVLREEGFIQRYFIQNNAKPVLEIFLKYYQNKIPVIDNIKRISRPGLRVYKNTTKLPQVMSGMGIVIVSTSGGVMTAKKARKLNIGGEIMCYVS